MKIIFSRKGFDSSSGGNPSPIFPDGSMVSIPIPDKRSPIRYKDILWQDNNLGTIVSDLTDGRIDASYNAHLDPDINRISLSRHPAWRPIFGQTGAAQGHLRKNAVQSGDIYLFFGLFRNAIKTVKKFVWDKKSSLCHVIWGWFQIDEVIIVDDSKISKYDWARYHPHFHRDPDMNNTIYIARRYLKFPGVTVKQAGAGVFHHILKHLVLTSSDAHSPSRWELPEWFYPRGGKCPLTYHADPARWQKFKNRTILNSVSRGQEFILDSEEYPEAIKWLILMLRNQK